MTDEKIDIVDTQGTTETWPDFLGESQWTVCIFTSVQCPYALAAYPTVDRIAIKYNIRGVQFRLINSNLSTLDDPEYLDAMRTLSPHPKTRFFRDEGGRLAVKLGASHTPHAFVLDQSSKVLWSGPIDHRFKKPDDWTEDSAGFWPWDDVPPPELLVTELEEVLE